MILNVGGLGRSLNTWRAGTHPLLDRPPRGRAGVLYLPKSIGEVDFQKGDC